MTSSEAAAGPSATARDEGRDDNSRGVLNSSPFGASFYFCNTDASRRKSGSYLGRYGGTTDFIYRYTSFYVLVSGWTIAGHFRTIKMSRHAFYRYPHPMAHSPWAGPAIQLPPGGVALRMPTHSSRPSCVYSMHLHSTRRAPKSTSTVARSSERPAPVMHATVSRNPLASRRPTIHDCSERSPPRARAPRPYSRARFRALNYLGRCSRGGL